MELDEQDLADQLNHKRLVKAYLRLAAETKKIQESPGATGIKGEAPKPKRKPKQPKKEQPQPEVEQLRLF